MEYVKHLRVPFLWAIGISRSKILGKKLWEEEQGELEEVKGECMLPGSSESFIEVLDWFTDRSTLCPWFLWVKFVLKP